MCGRGRSLEGDRLKVSFSAASRFERLAALVQRSFTGEVNVYIEPCRSLFLSRY